MLSDHRVLKKGCAVYKRGRREVVLAMKDIHIVEGVESMWFYHLSETGKSGQPALCGNNRVMNTEIPVSTWGQRGHLNEKYCKDCENLGRNIIPVSRGRRRRDNELLD